MYVNGAIGTLGETGEEIHSRAKRYVPTYEQLHQTAKRVKNDEEVKRLMSLFGEGRSKDDRMPHYYYAEVKQYLDRVEGTVPISSGYAIWTSGSRPIHRVDGLQAAIKKLEPEVEGAAKRYGLMPQAAETKIVEREKIVEKIIEGEFMGLPVKTWLYISAGIAGAGVLTAVIVAATKPKAKARAAMAGTRRRRGMGH